MESSALFRIEGHFDVPAALDLREKISAAASPVALDFSHAAVDDSTIALLTVNVLLVARRGYAVELRGLRDHQCKLLEHFGIALDLHGQVRILREA